MPKYHVRGKDAGRDRKPHGSRVVRRDEPDKEAASTSARDRIRGDFSEASLKQNAALLRDKSLMQPMYSTTRAEISRQIQQGCGNRYVQRLFRQPGLTQRDTASLAVVQRDWVGTENSSLSDTSARNIRILKDLIAEITRIPGSAGTIVPREGSTDRRIDMQGEVPRGDDTWANIQCQVGGNSVGGVICPFDLDLEEVKRGLVQALETGDILEWAVEVDEEVDDEMAQWVESETADTPSDRTASRHEVTPIPLTASNDLCHMIS